METDQEYERKERAEDRRAQASMMGTFMMAMIGRSFSAEESPTKN
jgi:hypothetical protein